MICQVFGLIAFLAGALSLDPTGKYCTLQLDPTGKYNCPNGMECKGGPYPWGKNIHPDKLVKYGRCQPKDLDPTGKYCSTDQDCAPGTKCLPPTPWHLGRQKRQPDPGFIRMCREEDLDPTGVYCNPKCVHPQVCVKSPHPYAPNQGICVNLDPTGKYCVEDVQCVEGQKCVSSGRPEYGICQSDLDPTGKYCASTSDCKWYLLEKCSDQGECTKYYLDLRANKSR